MRKPLLYVTLSLVAACGGTAKDPYDGADLESAVSDLGKADARSNRTVLSGTLPAYNTTVEGKFFPNEPGQPRQYVGWEFNGKKGEAITISLEAKAAYGVPARDGVLYLYGPKTRSNTYRRPIASNDDRDWPRDLNPLVEAKLPADGTYLIVAAEYFARKGYFDLTLNGPTVGGECRAPTVKPTDRYYNRFEGTHAKNDCQTDADCVVGGCSGEVCAAEGVISTCEALPVGPSGACGCVAGQCQWHDAGSCEPPPPLGCEAVLCLERTTCVVVNGRAECVPQLGCETVLCAPGTYCSDVSGRPECLRYSSCATLRCAQGWTCEDQPIVCVRAPCPPSQAACVPQPCPPAGTVIDCQPIVPPSRAYLCSGPYHDWLGQNCDVTFAL
jgi:eight-cysteine-cluster-containing protein